MPTRLRERAAVGGGRRSNWREHAIEIGAVAAGVLLIAIAIYALTRAAPTKLSTDDARKLSDYIFASVAVVTGVVIGAIAMQYGFARISESTLREKIIRRVEDSEQRVLAEFEKGRPVKLVDSPDEIWAISLELIQSLASSRVDYKDRRAYDVTTFLNRIRYEEAIATLVESEAVVDRIYSYSHASPRPADRAVMWFFESIIHGQLLELSADIVPHLLVAFKEKTTDQAPAVLEAPHLERLRRIVERQHNAYVNDLLRVHPQRHRLPTDFVATQYLLSDSQGESGRICEVMANFKTEPGRETYVVGVNGRGELAAGYIELHRLISSGFTS